MNYNSTKNQRIKSKFVEREVIYCVSHLVSELLKMDINNSDYSYEEILDICNRPDYEAAVEYADDLHVMYSNYLAGYVWVYRVDHSISEPFDTELEAYQDCVYENDLEYDYIEAYEHWIVSDYLAKKLEEQGEMVTYDLFGLTVWGRCTSGQSIMLDGVISRICEGMEILEGQKHEWEV